MELILEPPPDAGSDQAYADYVAELLESGFNLPPQDDDADDGDAEGGGAVFSQQFSEAVQGIDTSSATSHDALDVALAQLAAAERPRGLRA